MLEQCFKSAYIALSAGQIELKVEFGKSSSDTITQIEDLLEGLEKLARTQKKPVVLFFDEFQDVLKADETNKIQAVIRGVAQHSKYVTYIFSGSSRLMLQKVFEDKKQPLYMLCNKMVLDRIGADHFKEHIQFAAQQQWKKHLEEEIVSIILLRTESHPYYVNLLCNRLWESEKRPEIEAINLCWNDILVENKGKIIADLEPMNTNRLKVITNVALLGVVSEPNSKAFLDSVQLPLSSTQNAIKYLMDYDYLYEAEGGVKLVDPLIRKFIVERY